MDDNHNWQQVLDDSQALSLGLHFLEFVGLLLALSMLLAAGVLRWLGF
jgi:hypothetical protein